MSDNTIEIGSSWAFLPGAMFLIFMTLKLCKVITWSWWLVTLPLTASIVILVGLGLSLLAGFILVISIASIIELVKAHLRRKKCRSEDTST
jgi:hypothetical protein